jgi:predicted alpha/beta-hydrolase family hydrolase
LTPRAPIADFVFAHGAGAGKDSSFIVDMANLLEAAGVRVHLFNFAYMNKAIALKKRHPPSKMPVLCDEFIDIIRTIDLDRQDNVPLLIGGKSMGSRVACEIADRLERGPSGVIAYGYPFHPPNKPDKSRLDTLTRLTCPCVIIQGESDALGNQDEIEMFDIPENISVAFVPTANHDLKPLKRSGWTHEQTLQFAADKTVSFIRGLS